MRQCKHTNTAHNIMVAFLLNFSFAILEVIGGIYLKSAAILSDAIHDFGDSLSLGISYVFARIGDCRSNCRYTYGYKRITVIGAVINIMVLGAGSVYILKRAIESFRENSEVMAGGMIVMAVFGTIVNAIPVLRMRDSQKLLDKTVMFHLMEDMLGWIAVLLVSIVMYFTKWYILDSILSLVICVIILQTVVSSAVYAFRIIMQAVPDDRLCTRLKEEIMAFEGVEEIMDFHMWTIDGERHVVTMTLATEETENTESYTRLHDRVKEYLEHEGIDNSTIEITETLK